MKVNQFSLLSCVSHYILSTNKWNRCKKSSIYSFGKMFMLAIGNEKVHFFNFAIVSFFTFRVVLLSSGNLPKNNFFYEVSKF